MRYQQGIVLSEKSRTKWFTQVEATDFENSILVDNLSWTKIITQNITEFFINFGKPHHPASKDSLAQWVKEIMGNSGIYIKKSSSLIVLG